MTYDAIILGANYGGLAAAGELRGKRVLLLDRVPIGSHQASTCALWTRTIEALGASHAILQTLHAWHIHIGQHAFAFPTPDYPISVMDHSAFCSHLFSRTDATFSQEVVREVHGNEVITDKGRHTAPVIIEALGWRGIRRRDGRRRAGVNLGYETEVAVNANELALDANGLHVYFSPWRWGIGGGWVFPSGDTTRVGFGRYDGAGKLDGVLSDLLSDYQLSLAPRQYGNYLPWRLRDCVVDGHYVVGDAAGQCLGLLGEGIRTAIYFGIVAARCAGAVLDGRAPHTEGLARYQRFVAAQEREPLPYYSRLVGIRLLPQSRRG